MSHARAEVLASIRRSLGVTGHEAPRRQAVDGRLSQHPAGVRPARARIDGRGRLDLFRRMVEDAKASLAVVATPDAVPEAVAEHLRLHNLPATVRMGTDAGLAAMPWDGTTLDVARGPSTGGDLNAVSHAFAAIAETGTLALVSGPDNPSTLNFLPDNHIVVVEADDVLRDMEEAWERLRARFGADQMPRTLNLITGPSRSGDIERTLLLGAHGPRSLHVILIDR